MAIKKTTKKPAAKSPRGKKPPQPTPKPTHDQGKSASSDSLIMDVYYKGNTMSVSRKCKDGQLKRLELNLEPFDQAALSSDEQFLIYHVQGGGKEGVPYKYNLSIEEMKTFVVIKEKLDKAAASNKEACPADPPAPISPSNPLPDKIKSVPSVKSNGKAEAASKQSAERVGRAVTAKAERQACDETDRLRVLNNVVKKIDKEEVYFQLEYDIPVVVEKECPNPSGLLWCFGFRMTLSCWVVPRSTLENPIITGMFDLWAKWGVKKHIIKYAADQVGTIRAIAVEKLQEEVERVERSFRKRMDSATTRLAEARKELDEREKKGETVSADEYEYFNDRRDKHVQTLISESTECLLNAIKCAELFEVTSSVEQLIGAVRNLIRGEALTFNAEMSGKGAKRSQLAPVIE